MKTRYKFMIKTGSGTNTGTNSRVYFKLYGSAGVWEETELKPASNNETKFAPNSLTEVNLVGPVIGDMKKFKIWHDGKSIKDSWYLDFVEITCYKLSQTVRFICDQWLSTFRPPNYSNSIVLNLHDNIFDNEKIKNQTEYMILIKTSSKPLLGDDVVVQFQFDCTNGKSQVFNLLTPFVQLFDQHQLDCFLVSSSHDLGRPEKLRMAYNLRKKHNSWTIEYVKIIYSRDPNNFYLFKVEKWVEKNQRLNALVSSEGFTAIAPSNTQQNESKSAPKSGKIKLFLPEGFFNYQLKELFLFLRENDLSCVCYHWRS